MSVIRSTTRTSMKPRTALLTVLVLGMAGLLFSGYLSYRELFGGGCSVDAPIRCGSFRLADLPACVYGFVMYLVITTVAALGLQRRKDAV